MHIEARASYIVPMKPFEPMIGPDVARVAALLADPSRLAMIEALLEGPPLASRELARRAGVTAATASSHLAKLVAARFVVGEPRGRLRMYALASSDVARAFEALAAIAPRRPAWTVGQSEADGALRAARTCYDHLAGRLGVALTEALVARGVVRMVRAPDPAAHDPGDLALAHAGQAWLAHFGVDVASLEVLRRPLARACLDWSERRPHLAGALGAAITARLLETAWVRRVRGGRAVRVTDAGRRGFARAFGGDILRDVPGS
jgi:DNA-binding transcriptional ArsR family regulator